ncbi:MAG: Tim44 domain-containing protein [Burkholderiaceae bacterium]
MFNCKKSLASKSLAVALGLVLVFTAVGFAPTAEAKRMGGGSSFGRQMPIQRQATPPRPAQPAAAPAQAPAQQPAAARQAAGQQAAAAPTRSWMGPLAGIAAGLGLAALASYLGIGAELMSFMLMLLAGLAIFAIVRMVMNRNRLQPAGGPSGHGSNGGFNSNSYRTSSTDHSTTHYGSTGAAHAPASTVSEAAPTQPNQAEIDQFLQVARKQFTELQKVWDNGDMTAIRGFVTESMAYGLEKQLAERGSAANHTAVVSLHVEWLGMDDATDEDGRTVDEAYVRFYGLIREALDGAAQPFDEVWTLQKPKDGSGGWLLAGILQQQAS